MHVTSFWLTSASLDTHNLCITDSNSQLNYNSFQIVFLSLVYMYIIVFLWVSIHTALFYVSSVLWLINQSSVVVFHNQKKEIPTHELQHGTYMYSHTAIARNWKNLMIKCMIFKKKHTMNRNKTISPFDIPQRKQHNELHDSRRISISIVVLLVFWIVSSSLL